MPNCHEAKVEFIELRLGAHALQTRANGRLIVLASLVLFWVSIYQRDFKIYVPETFSLEVKPKKLSKALYKFLINDFSAVIE